MKSYNVLVCGIGGTGVMEFGALLRQAGIAGGMGVVGLERRGASQRGGGATSSARFTISDGEEPYDERRAALAGTVSFGMAELLIATEAIQALRNMHFVSRRSQIVLNNRAVRLVGSEYPDIDDFAGTLKGVTDQVYALDASELSMERFGSYRWTNPILLGVALANTRIPLERESVERLLSRDEEREALALGLGYKF